MFDPDSTKVVDPGSTYVSVSKDLITRFWCKQASMCADDADPEGGAHEAGEEVENVASVSSKL